MDPSQERIMHVPVQPLSEVEEAELDDLLEHSGSVTLPHARGAFTAIGCEPSLQDPADWLPLVLGSEVAVDVMLKRIFTLLLRDLHAVAQCLALGQPSTPLPRDHEAVVQFCKGFVRVTRGSTAWQNDPEALELVLPLAVLAGYLPLESLRSLQPDVEFDAATWPSQTRRRLPDLLMRVYGHLEPLRQRQLSTGASKVGRNEPCPCGSGRKFKKCCGVVN
jgi:uncharacterized protein